MKTALAFLFLAGAIPVCGQDKQVHYWMELSDTLLRPGEEVEALLWASYEPGPGSAVTYKGYPATVIFFAVDSMNLHVNTGVTGGSFTYYELGPKICTWGQFLGEAWGNSIYAIAAYGYYPNFQCPYTPTTDNPLCLYKFRWKPQVYSKDTAWINVENDGKAAIAYEVPALNLIFPPNCGAESWPVFYSPAMFEITDEACIADCDADNTLAIDDFICFQTNFATGDPKADCDGDGELLIDDFVCFQTLFVIGC